MLLLEAEQPVTPVELAQKMGLSARQVNYDLKSVQIVLSQKKAGLRMMPRIGIDVDCTQEQRSTLVGELGSANDLQLILSSKQRQQLIALILLTSNTALMLQQFQDKTQVSRMTVIKDLDSVERWLSDQSVRLERKPNYGFACRVSEKERREALVHLLWEGVSQTEPLLDLTHFDGLRLHLANERHLLPIVDEAFMLTQKWDTSKCISLVTEAEAKLGGRFSDDAVLFLALTFAVQAQRVQSGQKVEIGRDTLAWLKTLDIWSVAKWISSRLSWFWFAQWPDAEIGWVCMHLLSASRNEGWPSDTNVTHAYSALVEEIVQDIASAYGVASLNRDPMLRDGIVNCLIPAFLRQRFSLRMSPATQNARLASDDAREAATIARLVNLIEDRTGILLPEQESSGLELLMRAAYIRACQDDTRDVIVVCPSGMATAQLLIARMRVYFPRFNNYRVVALRELRKQSLTSSQLIIATVPLPEEIRNRSIVVQVHPMLLPTDVEKITRALA
jgi:mannitol operon transcriptional antiterminator